MPNCLQGKSTGTHLCSSHSLVHSWCRKSEMAERTTGTCLRREYSHHHHIYVHVYIYIQYIFIYIYCIYECTCVRFCVRVCVCVIVYTHTISKQNIFSLCRSSELYRYNQH